MSPSSLTLPLIVALLATSQACGPGSVSRKSVSRSSVDKHHAILDLDDRCPWLPSDCRQLFADDNHCPDRVIDFPKGSAVLGKKGGSVARAIGAELAKAEWALVADVIGYDNSQDPDSPLAKARAKAVVKALVEAGVAPGRLRAIAGRTTGKDPAYAAVFIIECTGQAGR